MNIIKNRKISLGISGLLTAAAIVVIAMNGFNLGIDFSGGTLMESQFAKSVTTAQIQEALSTIENSDAVIGSPRIQASFSMANKENSSFLIRTRELNDESHSMVINSLQGLDGYEELSFTRIGPVVGESLKQKAIKAIVIAILLIIVFVAWAFRKVPGEISSFRFGIVAVMTLIHDVLITLGVFSFFGLEIDSFFVVAMLTVLGFSVNDTIVVFDRVRERLIFKTHDIFEELAEQSIKDTIMRSINTSATLLITLFALYFFAGASIQTFILALIIGMFIGTYSSIFVATPLLVVWDNLASSEEETVTTKVVKTPEAKPKKKKAKKKKK